MSNKANAALNNCLRWAATALLLGMMVCIPSRAQKTPTLQPQQAPGTSPKVEQTLPSYEGQKVASVELAGRPDLDKTPFVPLLAQHAGEPFSQAKVEETVAALKRTGKFQNVEVQILPEASGIRVLFVLQPAMYFGIYDFPGAIKRFPYSRLLQVSNYPPRGGTYTDVEVQDAERGLLTFFRRSGYFLAEVHSQLRLELDYAIVNVIFNVTLGKRAKFGNVIINGASPQETAHLENVLHSTMARLRGSAIRPGKTYKLKTVQNASQYLENTLNKQGYLAAQVRLAGARYDPETNRADITYDVQPGSLVHVKVQGVHIWSWTKRKLLPVLQQAGVNPELIQEGRQNLLSYMQSKGYFDAKVQANVEQGSSTETILYQVTKGPRHKVEQVSITGNRHLSEKELMSHVQVKKRRFFFFSHGKYSEKLLRTSVKNISNLYKAEGFSDVDVTPQVKTDPEGDLLVAFRIEEGQQDIVTALHVIGNNTLSEAQFAPKSLKIAPGRPYSQKLVDQDRTQILSQYLDRGYLTATVRATAHEVGKNQHKVEVTYNIYEGPQVRTATVVTLGRQNTNPRVIHNDTANIQPGRPLKESDMLSSGSKLYNDGVFDWAEVSPRREITTQTQEDVLVKLHESDLNSIVYGFGFEVINRGGSVPGGTVAVPGLPPIGLPSTFKTSEKTFWGPRGSFQYTRKNVRGKAESINLSGLAGRLDQHGSAVYINPSFRWTKWQSNLSISGEHNSENPIFTSRYADVGWQLQRALNPDKTQNFFVRYGFRETGLTHLLIPDLVPPEDRHVRLSTVSGTYFRDTRDNTVDAHKGIYETLEVDLNPSALGSSVDFAKLLAQAAYYKNIGAGIIWANSLRIGLAKPFAGSHVPVSEKFFSGGGSTLRGFPLNGAGPQHEIPACGNPADPSTCSLIQVPVGGNELMILNSEFRFPLSALMKNLGFATFYDGGNVFPTIGFHGQYTNTIGVGLRYSTPVGPIRFDIGHNLNAPPGIKSTQFFITLGQAF